VNISERHRTFGFDDLLHISYLFSENAALEESPTAVGKIYT